MGVLMQQSSAVQGSSSALRHRTFSAKDGHAERVRALALAHTPLLPLYADDTTLYIDAMTSLVQVTRQ